MDKVVLDQEKLVTGDPVVAARREWGYLPPEERFGVGVLGLHEGATLLVSLRQSQLCRVTALCDQDRGKLEHAATICPEAWATERYEEMLQREDVQIVAIYTPDPLHAEHIVAAFRAGKHVICTKPLISDRSAIPDILRESQRSGCRLLVGQSTRFGEPFLRQREMYEAGAFGEVEVLDTHYNHEMAWFYEKSPWAIRDTHWAYLGLSHPIDLVRWYLGPIQEVHAYGTTTEVGRSYGVANPDAILVNLVARNGKIARVMGNYGIRDLRRARSLIECFLMGSKGSSLARYPELVHTYHDSEGFEAEQDYTRAMTGYYYRHQLQGMHFGEFCNYADYFASKLLSGEDHSPDLREGLETFLTMEAVVRSLTERRPVQVDSLEDSFS